MFGFAWPHRFLSDTRLPPGVGPRHLLRWLRTRKLEDVGEAFGLVPEATESTKATLTPELLPCEMTIDYNGSPCSTRPTFGSLCQIRRTPFPRRKDVKERVAAVTKESKKKHGRGHKL